jgi:hypothetical protein
MPGLTELGRQWNDAVESAGQRWGTLQFSGPDMTHQAEQPNPVPGIVETARQYLQSGDYNPAHEPGTDPRDYLRELLRNPDIMAKNIDQASQFNFGGVTKALSAFRGSPQRVDLSKIGTPEEGSAAANLGRNDLSNLRGELRDKLYPESAIKELEQKSQDYYENTLKTPKGYRWENGKLVEDTPEKIQAAATRYGGKVYTGNVHFQSLEAAAADHGMDISQFIDKVNKEAGKTEATHDLDGFVTTSGRFVTRQEARDIADRADQLTNLARKEGKPNLSMEEIALGQRPGFGQPSRKMSD